MIDLGFEPEVNKILGFLPVSNQKPDTGAQHQHVHIHTHTDTHRDVYVQMYRHTWRHAYTHAHRHTYRHAYRLSLCILAVVQRMLRILLNCWRTLIRQSTDIDR